MTYFLKKLSIAILVATTSMTAVAYDEVDRAEIEAIVESYQVGIDKGDFEPMIESMTPKLFAYIADKMNMSIEQSKTFMVKMSSSLVHSMTGDGDDVVMTYEADLDKAEALISQSGREYVIFPTHFTMTDDKDTYHVASHAVAIEDEGTWYINRLGSQKNIALTQILYPDIVELDVPDDVVEVVPLNQGN